MKHHVRALLLELQAWKASIRSAKQKNFGHQRVAARKHSPVLQSDGVEK